MVLRVEPARVVAPPPSEPLSIEVRDDITFRIPVGANIEYVAALVTAVRNSC